MIQFGGTGGGGGGGGREEEEEEGILENGQRSTCNLYYVSNNNS
jgi:hypothetical protein